MLNSDRKPRKVHQWVLISSVCWSCGTSVFILILFWPCWESCSSFQAHISLCMWFCCSACTFASQVHTLNRLNGRTYLTPVSTPVYPVQVMDQPELCMSSMVQCWIAWFSLNHAILSNSTVHIIHPFLLCWPCPHHFVLGNMWFSTSSPFQHITWPFETHKSYMALFFGFTLWR